MGDGPPQSDALNAMSLDMDAVAAFAKHALGQVPTSAQIDAAQRGEDIAAWIVGHVLPPRPTETPQLRRMIAAANLHAAETLDIFIPAAARQLGEMWLTDALTFADVTLASAQLMQLVREVEAERDLIHTTPRLRLLVVSCSEEQHILGPQLLTSQLRRRGHDVQFLPGASPDDVLACLQKSQFACVLISAASWATLDGSNRIASALLDRGSVSPRVVLGGAVVSQVDNLKAKTPVHWVTNDISAALDGLGDAHGNQKKVNSTS